MPDKVHNKSTHPYQSNGQAVNEALKYYQNDHKNGNMERKLTDDKDPKNGVQGVEQKDVINFAMRNR